MLFKSLDMDGERRIDVGEVVFLDDWDMPSDDESEEKGGVLLVDPRAARRETERKQKRTEDAKHRTNVLLSTHQVLPSDRCHNL